MNNKQIPNHVAIIMDGNGRWAKKRGQSRSYGHYMGGKNLFKVANLAKSFGVKKLSLYAFSTENWKRPQEEIDYLFQTPVDYYYKRKEDIKQLDYQVIFSGRRDRLPKAFVEVMEEIEKITSKQSSFILNICVDYGAYDELIHAFNQLTPPITKKDLEAHLMVKEPVDLLIRTSGEQRLSNFLLWQASYAEFYFTKVHWPSFRKRQFKKAILNYQKRHRRYGGLK